VLKYPGTERMRDLLPCLADMNHPTSQRVYRVSPWRRSVLWWIFGPWLLGCLNAFFAGGDKTREIAIVLGIFPAVGLALWHWLMSFTRLELSAECVRLRQVGYTLQVSWSDIESIRLDKGREGFTARTPMAGKGVDRLARLRFTSMRGVPLYDAEQQELLGQGRLIPIEAFAWHLRKGRPFGADIAGFAPHLEPLILGLSAEGNRGA
jgi:hypothetical protein